MNYHSGGLGALVIDTTCGCLFTNGRCYIEGLLQISEIVLRKNHSKDCTIVMST